MKLQKYNAETLTGYLTRRLSDIDCRERIVISFPFAAKINRVEIYCSESTPDNATAGAAIFGDKFNGIVSIQVFGDYTNKPQSKSSYSYKKELLDYVPTLVQKMYKQIEVPV